MRAGRLWWSLLDQGLVSIGAAVLTVQGARSLPADRFGLLATALAGYYLLFTGARAVGSEVYLVRFAGAPDDVPPGAARQAQTAVLRLAAVGSIVLFAGAVVLPFSPDGRLVLAALAVAVPPLLWQEVRRSVLIAGARPGRSAAASAVVLAGQLAGGTALHLVGWVSAPTLLLVWGAAAMLSAVVLPVRDRGGPADPSVRGWFSDGRVYWPRFLTQALALGGAGQLSLLLVAMAAGATVVGGIRAALLLLAPLAVLQQAAGYLLFAEVPRLSGRPLARFVAGSQIGLAALAAGWVLAVEVAPREWLVEIAGDTLDAGLAALPGMGLYLTGMILLTAPYSALRSAGLVREGTWLGLALMPLVAGLPAVVGALFGTGPDAAGRVGTAFGIVGLVSAIGWNLAYRVWVPVDPAGGAHRARRTRPGRVRPASAEVERR